MIKSNNYAVSFYFSQMNNLRNGTLQLSKNDWKLIEFFVKLLFNNLKYQKSKWYSSSSKDGWKSVFGLLIPKPNVFSYLYLK
jgi:hypothetical protein